MNRHLAIHTDAPILPLTRMFGDTANVEIGRAAGTNDPDCFYGWAEQQHAGCKAHHIVSGMDPEETKWVANTLAILGYQVVVTQATLFTEPTGDHEIAEDMPQRYDDAHSH
jgi:hypothetical protein